MSSKTGQVERSLAERFRIVSCPKCGAVIGEPCRSTGVFHPLRRTEPIVGIHIARKRKVWGVAS